MQFVWWDLLLNKVCLKCWQVFIDFLHFSCVCLCYVAIDVKCLNLVEICLPLDAEIFWGSLCHPQHLGRRGFAKNNSCQPHPIWAHRSWKKGATNSKSVEFSLQQNVSVNGCDLPRCFNQAANQLGRSPGWLGPTWEVFLAEFDKPEVWSNGGNGVMQDMYPFTYFDLYIYINIICHKFQEVPRGCANHFFSNNFTLSFLNFKYCPQDIGCCFESGNVTSEISSWVEHEAFCIFWNKRIYFQPMIIGTSKCLCLLFRKIWSSHT